MNTLGDLIEKAFDDCKDSPSNTTFSESITNALETYFEMGSGSTVDSGTVPSGYFVGEGNTTSLKGDTESCKTIIFNTCELLEESANNGNYILSTAITNGLKLLCGNAEIKCSVNGEVTQGSSTVTMSGTSSGSFTIVTTTLLNDMLTIFNDFNVKENEDYEEYLARMKVDTLYTSLNQALSYRLAEKIRTCLSGGVLNTNGELTLLGDVGIGTITFGE